MLLIWIVVALVFAVAEVATSAFFAAFLAAGAVAAAAVAFAGQGTLTQALAFAAVSLLGIVVARPWLRRRFNGPRRVETMSGGISMIGEVATVVETVAGRNVPTCAATAMFASWAKTGPPPPVTTRVLSPGTLVQIVDIEGSTLVVERTARIGGVAAPPAFS